MTVLRTLTFETGTFVNASDDGFDATGGTNAASLTTTTTSPIEGVTSADYPNLTSAYGIITTDDAAANINEALLYLSAYFRPTTLPSTTTRLMMIRVTTTVAAEIRLHTNGAVRHYHNGTVITTSANSLLTATETYRFVLRYTASGGSEAWIFDDTNTEIFNSSTADATLTGNATNLRIGSDSGSNALNGELDYVIVDDATDSGEMSGGLTSVTSDRTATWDVAASVASDRVASWDVLALVQSSRSMLWDVASIVTADRVASWDVAALVQADRALIWDTLQAIQSDRSLLWDVLAAVVSDRSATWDVLGSVTSDRVALWDVASDEELTAVWSDRIATWDVLQAVAVDRAASWDVGQLLAADRVASWDVRSLVTADRQAVWHVAALVVADRVVVWDVLAAIASDRAASWDVAALVTSDRAARWNVASELLPAYGVGSATGYVLSEATAAGTSTSLVGVTGHVTTTGTATGST